VAQKPLDFDNPTTLTQTPSGIEIAYFTEPRRAYALRAPAPFGQSGVPDFTPWREVPSVTTALDVLHKPALTWWGQKIGLQGVMQLAEVGIIKLTPDSKLAVPHIEKNDDGKWVVPDGAVWEYATDENLTGWLTKQKLTVNHIRDVAASRGTSVHDAFEAWAVTGKMPDPNETFEDGRPMYAPEEMPYVEGFRKFVVDMGDAWETTGSEVAVGSIEHGFAGRYDLRGKVLRDVKLIQRACTIAGEPLKRASDRKVVVVPGGTSGLVDLKTSKSVYGSHLMQLEAYEGAGVECGLDPTDWRAVLHVTKDGLYEFKRAQAKYEDFLAILHTYNTLISVEEALKT
jgi:hypothetical protein